MSLYVREARVGNSCACTVAARSTSCERGALGGTAGCARGRDFAEPFSGALEEREPTAARALGGGAEHGREQLVAAHRDHRLRALAIRARRRESRRSAGTSTDFVVEDRAALFGEPCAEQRINCGGVGARAVGGGQP
jgi:hypothetical protein